ncbi:MAG: hypothetical protein KAG53_10825 [Endozoicomonadaceae bacterium]|nr:hypothetical protein [Endozoicomonadaceae bacterium]
MPGIITKSSQHYSVVTLPTLRRTYSCDAYCFGKKIDIASTFATIPAHSKHISSLHLEKTVDSQSKYIMDVLQCSEYIKQSLMFRSNSVLTELSSMLEKDTLKQLEYTEDSVNEASVNEASINIVENEKMKGAVKYKDVKSILLDCKLISTQHGPTCKVFALSHIADNLFLKGKTGYWLPPYKKIKTSIICQGMTLPNTFSMEFIAFVYDTKKYVYSIYTNRDYACLSIEEINNVFRHNQQCIAELESIYLQQNIRNYIECTSSPIGNSIREISKKCGSVQGEVVSPEMLRDIALSIGIISETTEIEDVNDLKETMISKLHNEQPVIAFTQGLLSKDETQISKAQWEEHAIVIIGYNAYDDSFIYFDCNVAGTKSITTESLWRRMSNTNEKRECEFYINDKYSDESASLASDINSTDAIFKEDWHDCEQMLYEHSYYTRVNQTVFFKTDESGKKQFDREGLACTELSAIKSIRKSRSPDENESNFKQTIMTFRAF